MASRRQISVGGVAVGGGAPIVVQSMTSTPTGDARATLEQVRALAAAGSELVRVSLPAAADSDGVCRGRAPCAGADHRRHPLRLAAGSGGARARRRRRAHQPRHDRQRRARARDRARGRRPRRRHPHRRKLRVAARAICAGWPRRRPAEALVEAALRYAARFEDWGFTDYKLSVKSSSVPDTIAAYRALAQRTDAPLHVGVTEAGTIWSGRSRAPSASARCWPTASATPCASR